MNHMLFAAYAVLSLLFGAVNKTEQRVDRKLMEEFVNLDPEDQAIAFNGLNQYEKEALWREKLTNFLETNTNQAENQLVSELLQKLTAAVFTNGSEKALLNIYINNEWAPRALATFRDRAALYSLVTDYPTSGQYQSMSEGGEGGSDDDEGGTPKKNCECDDGSFFTCGMQAADCEKTTTCKYLADGCGFLTLYECDGKCSID